MIEKGREEPGKDPRDYLAIELWGKQLRSFGYYIRGEQVRAFEAKAPKDAIYKASGGDWITVGDLYEGHPFREEYEKALKAQGEKNGKA